MPHSDSHHQALRWSHNEPSPLSAPVLLWFYSPPYFYFAFAFMAKWHRNMKNRFVGGKRISYNSLWSKYLSTSSCELLLPSSTWLWLSLRIFTNLSSSFIIPQWYLMLQRYDNSKKVPNFSLYFCATMSKNAYSIFNSNANSLFHLYFPLP